MGLSLAPEATGDTQWTTESAFPTAPYRVLNQRHQPKWPMQRLGERFDPEMFLADITDPDPAQTQTSARGIYSPLRYCNASQRIVGILHDRMGPNLHESLMTMEDWKDHMLRTRYQYFKQLRQRDREPGTERWRACLGQAAETLLLLTQRELTALLQRHLDLPDVQLISSQSQIDCNVEPLALKDVSHASHTIEVEDTRRQPDKKTMGELDLCVQMNDRHILGFDITDSAKALKYKLRRRNTVVPQLNMLSSSHGGPRFTMAHLLATRHSTDIQSRYQYREQSFVVHIPILDDVYDLAEQTYPAVAA